MYVELFHLQGIWSGEGFIWNPPPFRFCYCCHYFTAFPKNPEQSLSLLHLKGRFSVVLLLLKSPGTQRLIKVMEMILFPLTVIVLIWWFSLASFHPELIHKAVVVPGTLVTTMRGLKLFLHSIVKLEQGKELLVHFLRNDFDCS